MLYIYILLLQLGKYYIGETDIHYFKLNDTTVYNNDWTFKYKPIKIIDIISNVNNTDVDKYTLHYMNMHGIDNVRGGQYYYFNLSNEQTIKIQSSINCKIKNHNITISNQTKFLEDNKHSPNYILIADLTNVKNQIDKLNRTIEITSTISINDIDNIKQELKNYIEITDHQKSPKSYNLRHNSKKTVRVVNGLFQTGIISDLANKINEIRVHPYYYNNIELNNKKNKILTYNNMDLEKDKLDIDDLVINALQIIKLNIESTNELNEIYKKYYSREFIVDILAILYRKEIDKLIEQS
jgi:hypothetical protein